MPESARIAIESRSTKFYFKVVASQDFCMRESCAAKGCGPITDLQPGRAVYRQR